MAMKSVDVDLPLMNACVLEDLPKCNEVILERLADSLLGVAPRDNTPSARSREFLSKRRRTVLSFDAGSGCVAVPCAVRNGVVLCCALAVRC